MLLANPNTTATSQAPRASEFCAEKRGAVNNPRHWNHLGRRMGYERRFPDMGHTWIGVIGAGTNREIVNRRIEQLRYRCRSSRWLNKCDN